MQNFALIQCFNAKFCYKYCIEGTQNFALSIVLKQNFALNFASIKMLEFESERIELYSIWYLLWIELESESTCVRFARTCAFRDLPLSLNIGSTYVRFTRTCVLRPTFHFHSMSEAPIVVCKNQEPERASLPFSLNIGSTYVWFARTCVLRHLPFSFNAIAFHCHQIWFPL